MRCDCEESSSTNNQTTFWAMPMKEYKQVDLYIPIHCAGRLFYKT